MSKTAKVEARVKPDMLVRYQAAANVLRMDEFSDFVRRACDDLADRTLANGHGAVQVTPRPRGGTR